MNWSTIHTPPRAAGSGRALGSRGSDRHHTVALTNIAIACAALDLGCATWSAHAIDLLVTREEQHGRVVAIDTVGTQQQR
jgi:hypothetical protein